MSDYSHLSDDELLKQVQDDLAAHQLIPQQAPTNTTAGSVATGFMDPVLQGAHLIMRAPGMDTMRKAGELAYSLGGSAPNPVSDFIKNGPDQFDQYLRGRESQYQMGRGNDSGTDWGRLAGNVANPINYLIPGGGPAAGMLGAVGKGALRGAAAGALSTPTPDGGAVDQAGIGAAAGGVLGAAGKVAGSVISPNVDKAVQMLRDRGLNLTPGKILGGTAQRVEDAATSIPLIGDFIKNANVRNMGDYNKAVINWALEPVGGKVDAIGREGVKAAAQHISDAFDSTLGKIKSVPLDSQFKTDMQDVLNSAQILPEAQRKQLESILKIKMGDKFTQAGGQIDGHTAQQMDSELGRLSRQYKTDPDADKKALGQTLGDVQESLRDLVGRTNPAEKPNIDAARLAFRRNLIVERAAQANGSQEGVFSPATLLNAVKQTDSSLRKKAVSQGTAMGQDIADAGVKVLGSKIPDSGTAGRYMLGSILGGALGGGAAAYLHNPIPLIGGAAMTGVTAGAYSKPGTAALSTLLAGRPSWAPALSQGVQTGSNLLTGPTADLATRYFGLLPAVTQQSK